jgi:hypothetical protein
MMDLPRVTSYSLAEFQQEIFWCWLFFFPLGTMQYQTMSELFKYAPSLHCIV